LVLSRDELLALSEEERSEVIAVLVDLGATRAARPDGRARRRFLTFVMVCIVALAVWIVALGVTLPARETVDQWRLAWIGLDVAELVSFAVLAWAVLRTRHLAIPAALIAGTLLLCDAWFDVVLSWNTGERWEAIADALIVEVPLAMWLWWIARRLVLLTITVARARLGLVGPTPSLRQLRLTEAYVPASSAPVTVNTNR
jgi:hypothetical protein